MEMGMEMEMVSSYDEFNSNKSYGNENETYPTTLPSIETSLYLALLRYEVWGLVILPIGFFFFSLVFVSFLSWISNTLRKPIVFRNVSFSMIRKPIFTKKISTSMTTTFLFPNDSYLKTTWLINALVFFKKTTCSIVSRIASSNYYYHYSTKKNMLSIPSFHKEKLNIPRHLAVIMDGNRRYGKAKYGCSTKGHWDGSHTLVNFMDWCMEAGIQILTVYAFSTENWNRSPEEVNALLSIFDTYLEKITPEALKKNVRICILSSESSRFPSYILEAIHKIESLTAKCTGFSLNICLSYGSRGEIVGACKDIARDVAKGLLSPEDIDEDMLSNRLLTKNIPDPDVLLRTSGEVRMSNFLLYQVAYSEMIFINKCWPEVIQEDLHSVLRIYSQRKRRYGK